MLNLQEIIEYRLSQWGSIRGQGNHCCATNRIMKISIFNTNQVFILQLILVTVYKYNFQTLKINYSIKALPTTSITVCGKTYEVKRALFHHGHNVYEGRYTSMLRSGTTSWISVDYDKIQKKSSPRNAKNTYTFFWTKQTSNGKANLNWYQTIIFRLQFCVKILFFVRFCLYGLVRDSTITGPEPGWKRRRATCGIKRHGTLREIPRHCNQKPRS